MNGIRMNKNHLEFAGNAMIKNGVIPQNTGFHSDVTLSAWLDSENFLEDFETYNGFVTEKTKHVFAAIDEYANSVLPPSANY